MIWLIAAVVFLFLVTAILLFQQVANRRKMKEMREQLLHVTAAVKNTELERISFKLNPHLFKNTLNSIQSHAYQTYHALDKLSEVLDYILYESDKTLVSVKEEVEFIMNFVEVNRLKLSPLFDLKIKNNISPQDTYYTAKLLMPLITVDLVENAFKHADIQSADSFISIVLELKDGEFSLLISNKTSTGQALLKERGGFGNTSLETKLQARYSGRYSLKRHVENNVYIAQLKIDLRENAVEMPVAG